MNPQELASESNKEKLLQARLSDTEKGFLFQFCQNEAMVRALEKALLYAMYQMGKIEKDDTQIHDVNWAFIGYNVAVKDEDLGRALRAKIEGLSMLYDAFKQIKKFGENKVIPVEEKNPAL